MSDIAILNEMHYSILNQLKNWRILSVNSLMSLSGYKATIWSFRKLLKRLESRSLIHSFTNPYSSKKYLYLTEFGDKFIGDTPKNLVSKNQLLHDAMVSEIVLDLIKLKYVTGFQIEQSVQGNSDITPDAILFCEKDQTRFNIALELELTRKSKEKYLRKIENYLIDDSIAYSIYVFLDVGILHSYSKSIIKNFGKAARNKILLATNNESINKIFCSDKCSIHGTNDNLSIQSFLGGLK